MAVLLRDVAARAGVSAGTVSNYFNRRTKVASSTAQRIETAIAELGYTMNGAARQLRVGRSRSVGLILLDARNPFFSELALGAEDRAEQLNLSVLVGNSDDLPRREARHLRLFEEQGVRGVLVSPIGDVAPDLQRLKLRGVPSVLIDRKDEMGRFSSVRVDHVAGGRIGANHLITAGRRRLAFVGGPLALPQVSDRLTGVSLAVNDVANVHLEIVATGFVSILEGRRAGEMLFSRPARDRPDAIVCANDLLAIGLLQAALMMRNVRVPEQIAIVGYDDIDYASTTIVPLTSIRQPSRVIGASAIELLEFQLANPAAPAQDLLLEPELIIRESTES